MTQSNQTVNQVTESLDWSTADEEIANWFTEREQYANPITPYHCVFVKDITDTWYYENGFYEYCDAVEESRCYDKSVTLMCPDENQLTEFIAEMEESLNSDNIVARAINKL